jgi:uncharacterized protein involved in oxidation of intracellular sulfur
MIGLRKGGKTMKFVITATAGSNDPTRATLPLMNALAAAEEGHDVRLGFAGEGAYLVLDTIVKNIQGVGTPPLAELWGKLLDRGAQVFV